MARYLFTQLTCPHCKDWTLLIEEVNAKLPPENRIRCIDVTNLYAVDIVDYPIVEKIKLDGTPTLYLGEVDKRIVGTSSRNWVKGFLFSYLKDEFIV